ncbi:hypothetical protein [Orenia marismortui]|uniref:Uncharacterized protein n=1 Tax=Orenia marismortui TaxID=46469 RepID=A0A4R8H230_9FIRM|nr:hypothetical protein [Orenia marismortui]TDX49134.1 hypothetical protein C7959_12028 [Orenia marismortui]
MSEKRVSEILKEQLEELCEVNAELLEKSKINLSDAELKTLEIVNNSIICLGDFFIKLKKTNL